MERIQNIKPVLEPFAYRELCEDDTKENAMLKCYLRMAIEGDAGIKGTIDIKVVKFLLETFNKRIQTFQKMVEMIKKDNIKELNNIYCNIKNSFLMVKKKYHPENLSTEPCSDTFIKNEKILNIIRERLTVRSTEKEQHGEVFTPPELICEMLDTLPASVWGKKYLRWLDPANGIGNFPVIVYYKLMDGLKKTIHDDKERSKHIIEKMLFMVELNPVNVKVSRKIFKMIDSDAKPNIVKANFLTESSKWKRELKTHTFDIVMGNPPYNEGGIRANSTENVQRGEGKTLWVEFDKKSLSILRDANSYLLFIHPASWISLKSNNAKVLLDNQIIKLRYYNYSDAHSLFQNKSGKIPITYYLIQNKNTKLSTLIYDNAYKQFIEFNIYENDFIPTESIEMMKKIYSFTKTKGSLKDNYKSVSNSSSKKDSYSQSHPFPLVNISKQEIIINYTNSNKLDNLDKKLLLPNSAMGYPLLDTKGILFPNSSDNHILVSNNNLHQLKQLQNYLFCNLIFYIIVITKTRMRFLDNKVFQILPNITNLTTEIDITDEFLIKKIFKLDDTLLKGYLEYEQTGEGRLPPATIKTLKSFDITKHENGMTKEQITHVETLVKSKPSKSSTKTRKSKKSPPPPTPKAPKAKTKRCPRGTHKNKKTGKCEKKIKLISSTAKGKYRTFKKRKHKKNKSRRR